MNINHNHQQDGEQAWKESGLHYGQKVIYKGKVYEAVAIGYGVLMQGKVRIANGEETLTVKVSDLKVSK